MATEIRQPGDRAGHWAGTYRAKGTTDVSWFQREPTGSLRLLHTAGLRPGRSVVDVGGGASTLVDHLLDLDVTDVTVLDIADEPLAASRARLRDSTDCDHTDRDQTDRDRAGLVMWLVQDVLTWTPVRRYDLWHDRAVFHFLTEPADRDRYRQALRQGLASSGHLVVATFAADGPTSCSGLPVSRYGPEALAAQFPDFDVVESVREDHRTPWDAPQPFTWLLLRAR